MAILAILCSHFFASVLAFFITSTARLNPLSAEVAVYTAAGQLVRQARVAEGSTLVNVAPGFYVVRANGTATKVIVR